jgi:hypothetical protein
VKSQRPVLESLAQANTWNLSVSSPEVVHSDLPPGAYAAQCFRERVGATSGFWKEVSVDEPVPA